MNAFMMGEKVDIGDFMHKIEGTTMLETCREDLSSNVETKGKPGISLNDVSTLSTQEPRQTEAAEDRFALLKDLKVGETVRFGRYWQDKGGKNHVAD